MSDDTDDHELEIEETVGRSSGAGNRPVLSVAGAGASDHPKPVLSAFDQRLLQEAGIPVEGMGDEEKAHILNALRASLPECDEDPLPPHKRVPAKIELSPEFVSEPQEFFPEGNTLKIIQETLAASQNNSENEEGEQSDDAEEEKTACDSISSSGGNKKDLAKEGLVQDSREVTNDGETTPTKPSVPQTGNQPYVSPPDSPSEEEEGWEVGAQPSPSQLTPEQKERMKLSLQQKALSQSRLKGLLEKVSQSTSSTGVSSAEEAQPVETETQASQDLFADPRMEESLDTDGSDNRPQLSPDSTSEPAASQDNDATQFAVSKDSESPPHNMADMETQPPDDYLLLDEEKDMEVELEHAESQEKETESSPAAGAQVEEKQRVNTEGEDAEVGNKVSDSPSHAVEEMKGDQDRSRDACSSPEPQLPGSGSGREGLTPSKLLTVDKKDRRPLLHDNRFSWPDIYNKTSLKRKYMHRYSRVNYSRKKMELSGESQVPYFCPSWMDPRQYCTVILNSMDQYFQRLTRFQSCLEKVAWGKPVMPGYHWPNTLDAKGRKARKHPFQWETEDSQDFQTQNAKPAISELEAQKTWEVGEKMKAAAVHSLGSGAGDAAYEGETQPFESDGELPDIVPAVTNRDNSQSKARPCGEKQSSPSPVMPASLDSQGSNSLLDENGDIYPTQVPLPFRKRQAAQVLEGGSSDKSSKLGKPFQAHFRQVTEDKDCASDAQPLRRKRKQISTLCQDTVVIDDDSEDFAPQEKKANLEGRKTSFIHISSSKGSGLKTVSEAVVHPVPRRNVPVQLDAAQSDSGSLDPDMSDGGKFLVLGDLTSLSNKPGSSSAQKEFKQYVTVVRKARAGPFKPYLSFSKSTRSDGSQEDNDTVGVMKVTSSAGGGKEAEGGEDAGLSSQGHGAEAGMPSTAGAAVQSQDPSSREEAGVERDVVQVSCPLCGKEFPSTVIEQHAWLCGGPELAKEADSKQASSGQLYQTSELRRRPLHAEGGVVCALCKKRFAGDATLELHFQECMQHYQQQEASAPAPTPTPTPTPATPQHLQPLISRVTRSKVWAGYKIPLKKDQRLTLADAVAAIQEEEEEAQIEDGSDDSNKDPNFALSKDDKKQEKDDLMGEESDDFQNSKPKKIRKRQL